MKTTSFTWQATALYTSLALLCGLFAGWIDFQTTEIQATLLVVLIGSAALGFIQPRGAWRWAILIALGLPLAYSLFPLFGLLPKEQPNPGVYATLIALLPALVGAYGGVLIRRTIHSSPV